MVTITFSDRATEKRALADQNIPFTVSGSKSTS
jgi:hypothetical protein